MPTKSEMEMRSLRMDLSKEAEQCLRSSEPTEVQKGVGLAMLALADELQKSRQGQTTLKSRKPEPGDIMQLRCKKCDKDTQCHLMLICDDPMWVCCECGKTIT